MIITLLVLAASPSAANNTTDNPDKIICRMEYQVHSRIPVRVCQTAAMWKTWEDETKADQRNAARHRQSGDPRAND